MLSINGETLTSKDELEDWGQVLLFAFLIIITEYPVVLLTVIEAYEKAKKEWLSQVRSGS